MITCSLLIKTMLYTATCIFPSYKLIIANVIVTNSQKLYLCTVHELISFLLLVEKLPKITPVTCDKFSKNCISAQCIRIVIFLVIRRCLYGWRSGLRSQSCTTTKLIRAVFTHLFEASKLRPDPYS